MTLRSPSPFRLPSPGLTGGGGARGEGPKTFLCLLLFFIAALSSAQDKIIRFHGYEGTLFFWSGNLSARAPASESGWLEPVLDSHEQQKWKAILTADGYGGEWKNFLTAAKDLPAGKGDASVAAQLLFKQVPEGARFLAVAPDKLAASGAVTPQGDALLSQGIGPVITGLGGPSTLSQITQQLGLQQFSGPRLFQAISQSVADRPVAVLTPARQIVWIESLPPDQFATIPAAAGRQPDQRNKPSQQEPDKDRSEPEDQPFPFAAVVGALILGAGLVLLIFHKPIFANSKPKQQDKPAAKSESEMEYTKAAKKLQQTLVQVPVTDPLIWLRDRAPQQVAELDKMAKIGHYLLKKIGITLTGEDSKDQQTIDRTLASLQKTEAEQRLDWTRLAANVGLKDLQTPEAIAEAIQSLKKQVADQEAFMRKVAATIDPITDDATPQEALHLSVTKLERRHQDTAALAQKLEKDAKTVEALKPGTYLGDQIRQSLHGVRPALADREVFAIVGYLLHYSLATLQTATINGDANLRVAMLHNLRTVCAALAPLEDSFTQICEHLKPMIGSTQLQPSSERHSDQADYLTLLQKALDLRNLRLSPFYIATDPQGRPYSVNTALA